jgi:putative ABC transport system ATP-binding protein
MYTLTDVTKRYRGGTADVYALREVSLTIGDGEFLAIRGQTGSGKSTLLQLLGGLDRPTSGSIVFDGQDIGRMSEDKLTRIRAPRFGFVFQAFNLIPTLSALENVETALVPMRVSRSERRERAARTLDEVGLGERLGHLPGEMSGGEQQRTAIARALVKGPQVIFADEPTGNLDEATRDDIISLLLTLWAEHGVTLIVVTHDAVVAERAFRQARLTDGRLELEDADNDTAPRGAI